MIMCLIALLTMIGCAGSMNYRRGVKAEKAKRYDAAIEYFNKALKSSPENIEYQTHYRRAVIAASQGHYLKGHELFDQAKNNKKMLEAAAAEFQIALNIDPTNQMASAEMENAIKKLKEIQAKDRVSKAELERLKEEVEKKYPLIRILGPKDKSQIDLKFSEESLKNIISTLAKIAGINVIYDKDIRDEKFSIEFHNVTFREALEQILAANMLFYKIIAENTILISPDNPQKRRQYEEQVVKTFYLSNAELNDVVNLVRNVTQIQKIATNPQLNAITIKDTPDRIAIAQKIIEANDKSKSEVLLNIEILEVNKSVARRYGIDIAPAYEVTQQLDTGGPVGSLRGNQFGNIDAADWIFTIPAITYRLLRTDSHTKTLARPQIRASEGQQVQVRLGNRIPVPITTFSGIGSVQQTPQAGLVSPITNYQQQDVGINIDVTPRVHHNREVTLNIRFELTSIASQGRTINEPPTIGNRTVNTVIRLMDGETNLLAGLLREDERKSLRGFPGIEKIPILRSIFAANDENVEQTDVIFTITPQIIRMPNITEEDLQPLWVGTEDQPRLSKAPPMSIFEEETKAEPEEIIPEEQPMGPEIPASEAPAEKTKVTPKDKGKETPGTPEVQPAPEKGKEDKVITPVETKPGQPPVQKPETTPATKEEKKVTPPDRKPPEPQKFSETPDQTIVNGRIIGPAFAKVGETFLISVNLDNVQDLTTAIIVLSYDAALVQMQEVREGELLQMSPTSSLSSAIDVSQKMLTIQISSDNDELGLTGSGTVCYIAFKALVKGSVQINVANSQFTNKFDKTLLGTFSVSAFTINE